MSSCAYYAVKVFLRQVTGNYFRNIHVSGLEHVPLNGPTILCCNHSNQFMDAMLLIAQCPRPLSFCFAASSFNKPIVGYLAKKINVIPVYRAEDYKVQGKGKIIMTSDTEVQGINTKFISEILNNKNFKLGIHSLLVQKKYKLYVEEIIDEEHLKVRSDPKIFEELKKVGQQNFFYMPKLDNSVMFHEACKKLQEGKAVCIFPEGTSHDRTHLLQLKPGVAYIALEAMANYGVKGIKILSCGLTYYHRDKFRSDVVLKFGVIYELNDNMTSLFFENKKLATEKLLNMVKTQMKANILITPTYQEFLLIKMIKNLSIPKGVQLDFDASTNLEKRIQTIYDSVRNEPKTKEITNKVLKYMEPLEKLGLEDKDLQQINLNYNLLVKKFIITLLKFIILLIFAVPMFLFVLPLISFVKYKAEKERNKSIEKNPNKIQGKDVVSSVKVVNFVIYFPLVGIFAVNFYYFLLNYFLFKYTYRQYSWFYFCTVGTFSFMFYGFLTINFFDSLKYNYEILKTILLCFLIPKGIHYLRKLRPTLVEEVNAFLDEGIKNTNFEKKRIINSVLKNIDEDDNQNIINEAGI